MKTMKNASDYLQWLQENDLKVAILHSGGPAPGSNRVLAGAAKQFLDKNIPVIGFCNGFEFLQSLNSEDLVQGKHYVEIDKYLISQTLDYKAFFLRTSRANPGKGIKNRRDLEDPEKVRKITHILDNFEKMRIGVLITIGGDDTLKTANYIYKIAKDRLKDNPDLLFNGAIVHVPKTIDNDYSGIAWTFGFFTAAGAAGDMVRGLYDDAKATSCYHVVEMMGRKSGWYTAAASIYGRATKAIIPEDYQDKQFSLEKLAEELVDIVVKREKAGKDYGVFCVSEGIAELLSEEEIAIIEKDRHGNLRLAEAKIGEKVAKSVQSIYAEKIGGRKKFKSQIVGYETRQIPPRLYDVLLTSQLGVGAFCLIEQGKFGEMVTVKDNLEIDSIPFEELVDPNTLLVKNRQIDTKGDFYKLLRSLEERFDEEDE
ncbi:MAG: 6-phosphofructokinase [Candidatus Delongbacteria bacterium]|jgi:6-phosphofructokinase|nr:6-phosphofructokinase [Candidatus Delongbacteria bacterium]